MNSNKKAPRVTATPKAFKAPPVYRPQPVPKVLQTKKANQPGGAAVKANATLPKAPAPLRPVRQPATLQKKVAASPRAVQRQAPRTPVHSSKRPTKSVPPNHPLNPVSGAVVQPSWGPWIGAAAGMALGAVTAPLWVPAAIVSAGALATGATGAAILGAGGAAIGYGVDQGACRPASRRRSAKVPSGGGGGGGGGSSSSSSSSSSSRKKTKSEPLVLTNNQKFELLARTVKRMTIPGRNAEHRSIYGWEKFGRVKALAAHVATVEGHLARDPSYTIKDTVGAMLDEASALKGEFDIWKTGQDDSVHERYVFRPPVKRDYGPVHLAPKKTKGGGAKERKSLVEWLTEWGWDVNTVGQSFFHETHAGKNVHLSFPMQAGDSTTQITEGTASGIWTSRKNIHITFSDYKNGSKNNPRVWYNAGGWGKSVIPAEEEDWLLTLTSSMTYAAGFRGVITS